ncbi:response regulator [Noviherbaspirillum galbum]|uniref:Response regulator transcription factor n=1 Tax=Noviherbaspirillum galbum TaxID=2709383 RepID=A0A6B3SPC7_9BURK|nr:response regulator transcription factor [Noviherbaspirillum galbum]NEX60566.1 response regulator transcription factor [Noviherbaspirillum galbum]
MQANKQYKVLLVDDHALVRAGIRSLIERIDGFHEVQEVPGVREALALLERFAPDIVITDITMGEESGLDLIPLIKRRYPEAAVVILSMHASDELASEALRRGASGYLLKEAAPAELEIALHAVTRKDVYLSPAVSTRVLQRLMHAPPVDPGVAALTPRQLEILKLIASRKSTKEIAYQLDLSEKTVAAHRAQIMERLNVRDVVGLALFAVKHGLVDKPD